MSSSESCRIGKTGEGMPFKLEAYQTLVEVQPKLQGSRKPARSDAREIYKLKNLCYPGWDLVLGAAPWPSSGPDLFFLQRSEQYNTCSQFFAQAFRHVISRPHTAQGLLGRDCLLPLKLGFMRRP